MAARLPQIVKTTIARRAIVLLRRTSIRSSFDGVVSAAIEWVAAHDPPDSHSDAPNNAVLSDGLPGIFRAAGREPAGGRPEARCLLIHPYQAHAHSLHATL